MPTLPHIHNNKENLYKHLALFAKVGVFEYKKGHAKLRIIQNNSSRIINVLSGSIINIGDNNGTSFSWSMTNGQGNILKNSDNTNLEGTQYTTEWLLLVDKHPEKEDFSTIGVLTGSKFMSLKHADHEAHYLFEAYGMTKKNQWGNNQNDRSKMYKVKRVLSRIKRGFQANILRQQVNLSRTRTRSRQGPEVSG
jgi:hypothetical protein